MDFKTREKRVDIAGKCGLPPDTHEFTHPGDEVERDDKDFPLCPQLVVFVRPRF